MFQWKFPAAGVEINSAVLLVNDKPQGLMFGFPCSGTTIKNYDIPPVYVRFNSFRSAIISAADGNVDIQ
jgi:hypothetical protein